MSQTYLHSNNNQDTIAFTILIDNQEKFQFIIKCMQNVSFQAMMAKLQKTYGSILKDKQVFTDRDRSIRVNKQGQVQKSVKYFINLTQQQYQCIIKDLFYQKEKPKKQKEESLPPLANEIILKKANQAKNQTKVSTVINEPHNKNAVVVPILKPIPQNLEEKLKKSNLRAQGESEEYLSPIKPANKHQQIVPTSNTKIYPQTMQQSSYNVAKFNTVQTSPIQASPQGKCCALI